MPETQRDEPKDGDVVITTADGHHYISVLPGERRMSFRHLEHAITMALNWAQANNSEVWRQTEGRTFKLR